MPSFQQTLPESAQLLVIGNPASAAIVAFHRIERLTRDGARDGCWGRTTATTTCVAEAYPTTEGVAIRLAVWMKVTLPPGRRNVSPGLEA